MFLKLLKTETCTHTLLLLPQLKQGILGTFIWKALLFQCMNIKWSCCLRSPQLAILAGVTWSSRTSCYQGSESCRRHLRPDHSLTVFTLAVTGVVQSQEIQMLFVIFLSRKEPKVADKVLFHILSSQQPCGVRSWELDLDIVTQVTPDSWGSLITKCIYFSESTQAVFPHT